MDNPFGDLYLKVQERILAAVPQIREVVEDRGQIDAYEQKPGVSFPCILIDNEFTFDDIGDNVQMAEGDIILRLVFDPRSSSSSVMPLATKQKALSYTDLEWKVYKALHGWQPAKFGYFARRKAVTEVRRDSLRVREIRFTTSFEDYSAQDQHTLSAKQPLDFEGEIEE